MVQILGDGSRFRNVGQTNVGETLGVVGSLDITEYTSLPVLIYFSGLDF